MLARPGEARQKPTPTQRRRKAAIEDPNDAVRRLQRLPPNKACADCTSKLTQCVNLSHGTFVCMACSGVHREFSHKIKGIGHSSFTAEEITKLQHSNAGNEAVNAKYLARYDPRMDRLKAPHNNNDMQLLRAWIKKKYIDKAWCERDAAVANNGAATKKSSSSSSKSSSRRKPKTTSAPVPPVAAATTPAAADPFGFDSIAPSAAANNSSWDAFGAAPAPPPANFQADFGNMNGTSSAPPPPVAAPPAAPTMPAFQADFGGMNGTTTATPTHQPPAPASTPFQANFGNNFSQPTMVSMPPPSMMPPPPPPQGQPQQMQPMPQQQPGQGNFVQTPTGNQQQQQPFQANFNQGMMQPPQQQPVQQSPFQANFDQGQMMQQHQVQQQQQQQQPPASASASGFRTNFDQLSQNGMMSANQQQQPQQSLQANFGETMAHQKQQQQPTQMNVGPAQTQVTMNQQSGGMNFGQFQEQQQKQHQQMGIDQQVGMDTNQQMPPVPQQPASVNVQSNGSAIASQIPENQPQQPHQELQPEAINPNAFQPADDKKDAFSAFDSLSLEPTNSRGGTKTPVREVVEKPKNLQFSKFKEGQQVVYTNSQGSVVAVIQKVHFDDELEPFYTINQNGREKQTDDAHLSLPNETIQNQPNKPSDQSSAKLEETAAMLKDLSESQLLEVQQFIASLQSFTQPAPMLSMGMAQQEQNDDAMNHSQQQMGGMSHQQTGSTPIHNQHVAAQENSMPPPQMASFQQPNRMQGMASNMGGIPTQMNAQQPMMQQQQQPTQMYAQQPTVHQQQPGQMYAQQQPAQVQGMGNTGMPQLTMQQQPMMSNVGSAQAQQQVPNPSMMQSMGAQPYAPSPTMAPTAPPPNNLAPVEKEGNPFDVY
uniref:Arf-GAP domain-containing protein n=1 Tax=Skeletonema marinoi TaxID=267567 RepID=A0A7S2PP83_9STRA